jgi:cellulose synthase/poly-beta-1,6-N-acetylglucosamine synthase-like glycosyltransferase
MNPFDSALRHHSPRYSPRKVSWPSYLITAGVTLLWLGLLSRAFAEGSLLAWSAGIVYVTYDTLLIIYITLTSLSLLKSQAAEASQEKGMRLTLGVIIAAFNEAPVIQRTLAAILQQSSPADRIIIADDGSADATAEVLAQHLQLVPPDWGHISGASPRYPSVYWLRLPHAGKAQTLNSALEQLDTQLVMTVDADTRLDPEAIVNTQQYFIQHPQVVAATGILTPECLPGIKGQALQLFQRYEYVRNFISRYCWMQIQGLLLISGALAIFRRDALIRVGGFDPESLVEDYEVIHRLHRYSVETGLDWQTAVLGNVQAITSSPSTFNAFLKQRRRWFAGFLQTQYWNLDMVGNSRFKALGLIMLPIKAFDTHQPIYGLSALALFFWYLFTKQYALVMGILAIIFSKILFDAAYHIWSIFLYRRWTGITYTTPVIWALLASVLEPFSFQLLRNWGATLGWFHFMTGQRKWGKELRKVVP